MRRCRFTGVALLVGATLCTTGARAACRQPVAGQPSAEATAARLDEGFRLANLGRLDAADEVFDSLLAEARRTSNRGLEGDARRGLATVRYARRDFAASRDEMERALAIFEEIGQRVRCAGLRASLGSLAFEVGDAASAASYWRAALADFRTLGNDRQQAVVLYNLAFVVPDLGEREALVAEGIRLARVVADVALEGQLHHALGDARLSSGDYTGALRELTAAAALLGDAGEPARGSLARVFTSFGRLYRAHGQRDEAIGFYRRALEIQESRGDWSGIAQSRNAIGVSLEALDRMPEAIAELERAVDIATAHLTPALRTFYRTNLASALVHGGDAARGIALLEADGDAPQHDDVARLSALAGGYRAVGRPTAALDAATAAIDAARAKGLVERLPWLLSTRASLRRELGRPDDGLSDALEAVALIENARRTAVPIDLLKQGFDQEQAAPYSTAVVLLFESGRHEEALEMAERGRARAFADLLATRFANEGLAQQPPRVTATGALASVGPSPASTALVAPASVPELRALARQLDTTILAYWVAPDATFAWVIAPGGELHAIRTRVPAARIAALARRSAMTLAATRGSGTPEPASEVTDAHEAEDGPAVETRGGQRLTLSDRQAIALRELHRLLIDPVLAWLPAVGHRVTVVPHGPLFGVSFAALQDGAGRYLVERLAVHYVPAGAVLAIAAAPRPVPTAPRFLLVADPEPTPRLDDGGGLPRLPAARREAEAVGRLLASRDGLTLVGTHASEAAVGRAAPGAAILHFATHGIVRNDRPFESFLALGSTPERGATQATSGTAAGHDGRLTVGEIYGFATGADLVVLSACGTAVGPPTGDGLAGLARAFFSTGASGVVATLWDVADEPSSRLVTAFYGSLMRQPDRSRALRDAQLRLLADLRAGRVTVATPAGRVALPEHPLLWAGFVLIGRP